MKKFILLFALMVSCFIANVNAGSIPIGKIDPQEPENRPRVSEKAPIIVDSSSKEAFSIK